MTLRITAILLLLAVPIVGLISVAVRWGRVLADVSLEKSRVEDKEPRTFQ